MKLVRPILASLIVLTLGCSGIRTSVYQTDNGFVRVELYYDGESGPNDRPPVCCVEVHPEDPDLVLSCEDE